MLIRTFFYRLFFTGFLFSFFSANIWAQEEVDSAEYVLGDTVLAREFIDEVKSLIAKQNFLEAEKKLSEAAGILNELGQPNSNLYCEFMINKGILLFINRKYDEAKYFWERVVRIQTESLSRNNKILAKAYVNIGSLYQMEFDFNQAAHYMSMGLQIQLLNLSPNHIEIGKIYYNLGNVHQGASEFDKSIDYYKLAINSFLSDDNVEKRFLKYAYNNLGNSYMKKGEYLDAIDCFQKTLDILSSILPPDHLEYAAPLNNIGVVNQYIGKFDEAEYYYQKGLEVRIKSGGEQHIDNAQSYHNLADIYDFKGLPDKSLYYYKKALELKIEKLGNQHPDLALTHNNVGGTYLKLGEYDKAIENYAIAKNIWENTLGSDHVESAFAYSGLGNTYYSIGEYEKALSHHNKALEIRLKKLNTVHPDLSQAYNNVAKDLSRIGKSEEAKKYFKHSLNSLNFKTAEQLETVISIPYLLTTLLDEGLHYKFLFEETKNIDLIESTLKSFEKCNDVIFFNIKSQHPDSRSFASQKARSIYEWNITVNQLAFKVTHLPSYLKNSFKRNESSKSFVLFQSIQETDALHFANIPDTLLQQEYDLRIDITYYDKKRQEKLSEGLEETDTTVLAISSKLFDLNREYEALKERFETDYPDYYKLKYDLSTVSLEYVQDTLLAADQTLLEYFVGDSSIFIFTVGKDKYDVVEVKRDFPLDDWVKQLQNGLTGYYTQPLAQRTDDLYKETIQQYIEASQQLYGKLVAPVKEQLNTSELIIVPDGLLGYVPFGTLLSGQPKRASVFDTYPFLEKDYKISYCYSATLLREMKEKQHKRQPTGSLVAFAPFYEGSYELLDTTFSLTFDTLANGQDTLIFNDVVTRKDFNNLPASGEEVKAASLFWNGDYYLNADATEDRFNEVAGNYRIVHLSTHGVADSRSGDYSYLAFAEQKDSLENEFLYVRDLYNIQLNADLVTLSACETAAGELQRGEGIISLARAFAYAGAKSILTTLWVADDSATRDLMKVFYQQLKNGEAKDRALQKAKQELLGNGRFAHPFFWAGFVPVGDMQALD